MQIDILVFLSIIGAFLIVYMIKEYLKACNNIIDYDNVDLVIFDESGQTAAFVYLVNKNADIEKLTQINKTLIDNHGYRIFKMTDAAEHT